jgi:hypothetical protein
VMDSENNDGSWEEVMDDHGDNLRSLWNVNSRRRMIDIISCQGMNYDSK